MSNRIDLKIFRIGIDNSAEPCTITIRAVVDSLEPLRGISEKFRQATERTIPAQLTISPSAEASRPRDGVQAEEIEQVIMEGLVSMRHSGQIAREIIRRFGGCRLAEGE
jgi:hypothetical protein